MDAVRNQKSNDLLNGMWMAPDRTLAERQEYQRLFTVKRGIAEITKRSPESAVHYVLPVAKTESRSIICQSMDRLSGQILFQAM